MIRQISTRGTKIRELIDEVKKSHPQNKWEEEIKARIKVLTASPRIPKPEPENKNVKVDDYIRATADRICNDHFSIEVSSKALISQFIRNKSKLRGVEVCVKTGSVAQKFEKGCLLGALVAFKTGDDLKLGWSVYNKNHEILPFTRKNAVRVAVIRGLADGVIVDGWTTYSGIQIPERVSKALPEFVARTVKYYSKLFNNLI